jgi:hypothetical protein
MRTNLLLLLAFLLSIGLSVGAALTFTFAPDAGHFERQLERTH